MSAGSPPFDRSLYRRRRDRSAPENIAPRPSTDFLHRRAMQDVVERLESVTRDFPRALMIGACGFQHLLTERCGVGNVTLSDLSARRLNTPTAPSCATPLYGDDNDRIGNTLVQCDEEFLPFADESFDLIVSLLGLHHVNDPVGALIQMRRALKPDGLMLCVLFAENTLHEWKNALTEAEVDVTGALCPRVTPFATIQDLGAAMQRAGFALPVVDVDRVNVTYQQPLRLLHDLRGMGEMSIRTVFGRGIRKDVLARALQAIEGQTISFDLVTLTGWAPHESQQKPLKPGSAKASMRDAVLQQDNDAPIK